MAKPGSYLFLLTFAVSFCPLLPIATAQQTPSSFNNFSSDSVKTVVASTHYQRSKFFQFFWGKHYRDVWAEPVQVPYLNLQKECGGLKPVKAGGSFQTKNLRLINPEGREFVIRSVDKDATKALPKSLQKSFIGKIMRDQTSVIHPYGAYIVPTLAHAAGIYHTNPKLVIIPDDPILGEYQQTFGGMLALFEERPEGEQTAVSSFGNAEKVVSSRKAFENFIQSGCHQVDARSFLKARLFDMWLGDWSRREDQWRWGIFKKGEEKIYKAIPRDRDHAFFKFNDGLMTWIASRIKPTYQTFDYNFRQIKGLNKSAWPMDQYLLAYLGEDAFKQIADSLQMQLSDAIIKEATKIWPANIYKLSGKEFEEKLISRRKQLTEVAHEYFEQLAKYPLVAGTDEAELFIITRLNNTDTRVKVVVQGDSDCKGKIIGDRIFHTKNTKAVSIFGLGGDDTFELKGEVDNGVKIRIYDGEGEDKIKDQSEVKSLIKKNRIYLSQDGNEVVGGKKSKIIKYTPLAQEYNGQGWLLRHRLH